MHQHHDLAVLPNGNILVVAWDRRSDAEVIAAGRNPNSISSNGVWFEKILEIKPLDNNEVEIIWEWYLFDHLIQESDSTKSNFGVVKNNPEKIDINFNTQSGGVNTSDWFHINAIDYNPQLDQIIFSSRTMNEIYVIDHSTTISEAAGSTGGNAASGGDILYRWGNPMVYQQGFAEDRKLYGQHDSQWIDEGLEDEGKIMIFNNGAGRPGMNYSSIEIIDPPLDNYNYIKDTLVAFGPEETDWTFSGMDETSFFSNRISGAQRLSNDNTLICSGNQFRIFEIDNSGNLVWDYSNPINQNGALSQGQTSSTRDIFRAFKYSPEHPAFENKDLVPGEPLELNPWDDMCEIYPFSTSIEDFHSNSIDFKMYPNPTDNILTLEFENFIPRQVSVYNQIGQLIHQSSSQKSAFMQLNTSDWIKGIYYIQIDRSSGYKLIVH